MLKLNDFATFTQVSIRLLHYYDDVGLLPAAYTDSITETRFYSVDQIPRLNRIVALHELGVSPGEIGEMLDAGAAVAKIRLLYEAQRQRGYDHRSRDANRLAEVEARLRTIEHENHMLSYNVVVKAVQPAVALTGHLSISEGQHPLEFFTRAAPVLIGAGLREHITATMAIYPRPLGIDRMPRTPFSFQPAYVMPRRAIVPIVVPPYGQLRAGDLPAYTRAISTIHEGPYNRLFLAHTALLSWAEANDVTPLGIVRETYLRNAAPNQLPLVEVQMPLED